MLINQFISTASNEELLQANDKLGKNIECGPDTIPAESLKNQKVNYRK
jgi:hypothetical protein